jgi:16S rRNA (uracil1498-N3)-methyltransferase
MSLPFFYATVLGTSASQFQLDEATSKHIIQVLRMKKGDQIKLTNGQGLVATSSIISVDKRGAAVSIISLEQIPKTKPNVTIAISPVKNNSRFEWFLEKATEIGVNEIALIRCTRTEKSHLKHDRLESIIVSAMLQSQQAWRPQLSELEDYNHFVKNRNFSAKYIAHCLESEKKPLVSEDLSGKENIVIFIGPEGDFTAEEIQYAIDQEYQPVTLGNSRLRTETAGIVAAAFLRNLAITG